MENSSSKPSPCSSRQRLTGKKSRKAFYRLWLGLGLIQLIGLVAMAGCGPAGDATASLLGVSPPNPSAAARPSDTLLSSSEPNIDARNGAAKPLRVNLAFFRSNLQADLTVGADRTYRSHVQWEEQPTTLPPPDPSQGAVLADFRDYTGCAVLSEAAPVRLCFNVMPDVSNLGINNKEMHLEGVDALGNPSGCFAASGAPARYELAQAVRTADSLTLRFSPVSGPTRDFPDCGPRPVELVLKSVADY